MREAEAYWNRIAEKYAKRPIKDMESYERTIVRTRAHLSRADQVLEVGCGTGSTALLLAEHAHRITATDISANMIAIAREKARERQIENVDFRQWELVGESLGSFDVVLAFNLLHLLPDLAAALRALAAELKPGGLLISKTVCLAESGWHLRLMILGMRALGIAPHVAFLTIESLESAIAEAGFEIIEVGVFPASPPSRFVVARKT